MRPISKGKKLTVRDIIEKLAYFSVFAYVISAISCEMVKDTAFISTIAIYFVFAIGVVFVISSGKIIVNEYVLFIEHSTKYNAKKDPIYPVLKQIIDNQEIPAAAPAA